MSARARFFECPLVETLSEFLAFRDVHHLSHTTKGCLREVRATLQVLDLREQGVDGRSLIRGDIGAVLRLFPALRSLTLKSDHWYNETQMRDIGTRLPKLRELNLGCFGLSHAVVSGLPEQLEALSVSDQSGVRGREISGYLVSALRRCTKLRELRVPNSPSVKDETLLNAVRNCANLATLEVSENDEISDAAIIEISERCNLESLDVSYCPSITGASIHALADNCPGLRRLCADIGEGGRSEAITDEAIAALARCESLAVLWLRGNKSITDSSIVSLATRCHGLIELDLSGTAITDAALEAIAQHCPKLKVLYLDHDNRISNKSIVALASFCANLRELTLESALVTDRSLLAISRGCVRLEYLDISSRISDTGLRALAQGCPRLDSLKLSAPYVTDSGMQALLGLTRFVIRSNNRISQDSLVGLIQRCPDMTYLETFNCQLIGDISQKKLALYIKSHIPSIMQSHPKLWRCIAPGDLW